MNIHYHRHCCDVMAYPSHMERCEHPDCPRTLRVEYVSSGRPLWLGTEPPETYPPCGLCAHEWGYCLGCERWYPRMEHYLVRVEQDWGIDAPVAEACEACLWAQEEEGRDEQT